MGDLINTNYSNASRYDAFVTNAAKAEDAIISDIWSGKITTSEQRQQRYDEVANRSFDILPDSWRELANKKGKTQEEIAQMAKEYQNGFTNFGAELVKYIDAKFGNGDGKLTEDEYVEYEVNGVNTTIGEQLDGVDFEQDARNLFAHIDQDKNNHVDAKEMAALMSTLDMSVGLQGDKAGGINGRIKVCDLNANMLNLIKPSTTSDGAAMDAKIKGMYGFLYGEN